ncbi:MAG: hypothetical protein EHM24_19800 [Acidobacteria bacterium]|nr:MAG: hypothetical protein EHM24_19800 [Acidobacteriota bacterium]
MWDWLNCHMFGRHEHGIWCDNGTIFLRCIRCGRRSPGWDVVESHGQLQPQPAPRPSQAHRLQLVRRGA